jgi:hypothetical protein
MSMPYLSEKTKQRLQELKKAGFELSVDTNFYSYWKSSAVRQVMPYQAKNGM